mmetsp:Transcript_22867/g.20333  ORF Transcript_22867/g.20333 Transcript_22867/m.20333 type:complete len:100 (+) Transcript_22867:29-328(+)
MAFRHTDKISNPYDKSSPHGFRSMRIQDARIPKIRQRSHEVKFRFLNRSIPKHKTSRNLKNNQLKLRWKTPINNSNKKLESGKITILSSKRIQEIKEYK